MSDDPTPRGPGPDPDGGADDRDERLAALLAVAPLDDHTRARLVRRALDAAPPRRRRPAVLLSAAAALLVLVATGAAILATSGGGGQTPGRANGGPIDRGRRAPGRRSRPGLRGAQVAPRDLGAVGDVTDPARLRQVVAGPRPRPAARSTRSGPPAVPDGAVGGVTHVGTVGTAVDGGQPAAILVGRDGGRASGRGRRRVARLLGRAAPGSRLAPAPPGYAPQALVTDPL